MYAESNFNLCQVKYKLHKSCHSDPQTLKNSKADPARKYLRFYSMEFRKTPWLATKKAMDRWMDGWMGPRNRISLVLPTIEGIQRNPS
jgi:hypothetical protein